MIIDYKHSFAHRHNAKTHTPAHSHDYCELVYYLSGNGSSCAENETFTFFGGDMILYPADCVHNETHVTATEVYCVGFTVSDLTVHTAHFVDDDGRIRRFVDGLKNELSNRLPHYKDMVETYIAHILIELLRKEGAPENYNEKNEMMNIANFINDNLQYKLTIATITDMSGYSYDYFRHIFKKHFGISPKKYLTDCQIKKAKELLTQTDLPIAAIAESCGFNTQEHFSFFFKKQAGVPPLIYRQTHRIPL